MKAHVICKMESPSLAEQMAEQLNLQFDKILDNYFNHRLIFYAIGYSVLIEIYYCYEIEKMFLQFVLNNLPEFGDTEIFSPYDFEDFSDIPCDEKKLYDSYEEEFEEFDF